MVVREYGLEVVAYRKNDYFLARSPFEESLTLFRQLSDQTALTSVLQALGFSETLNSPGLPK